MPILSGNKGQKLTLDLVVSNFKDYNFIIETTSGVFDTSEYNLVQKLNNQSTTLTDIFTGVGTVSGFVFAYNPTATPDHKISVASDRTKIKVIAIYDNTVQRIYVKSRRNFLGNQLPDVARP